MKQKHLIPMLPGVALLAYSGFFVLFNVLKYGLGLTLPFDPFYTLTETGADTVWHEIWDVLIIFGPMIALVLFLLPSVQFQLRPDREQILTISLLRSSRLRLLLMAACIGLFSLFCLYLLAENLG